MDESSNRLLQSLLKGLIEGKVQFLPRRSVKRGSNTSANIYVPIKYIDYEAIVILTKKNANIKPNPEREE